MTYASFWKRVAAYLIDHTIYFILCFIITVVLYFLDEFISIPNLLELIFFAILGIICYLYYFVYAESSAAQATLGKRLFGLKVTDLEGKRISFLRSLGRNLGMLVSNLTLYIGYLMCLWTKQKQCLHDKIADCLIVDKSPQRKSGLVGAVLFLYVLAIIWFLTFIFCGVIPELAQIGYPRHIPRNVLTPLMEASFKGNSEQVSQLIREGVDVNQTGYCGKTALFLVHHLDTVRLLLAAGAKVNVLEEQDPFRVSVFGKCRGWSPLMYAVHHGNVDIVKELLAAGADVNLKTTRGDTALKLAQQSSNAEVIQLLKQAGAKEEYMHKEGVYMQEGYMQLQNQQVSEQQANELRKLDQLVEEALAKE